MYYEELMQEQANVVLDGILNKETSVAVVLPNDLSIVEFVDYFSIKYSKEIQEAKIKISFYYLSSFGLDNFYSLDLIKE